MRSDMVAIPPLPEPPRIEVELLGIGWLCNKKVIFDEDDQGWGCEKRKDHKGMCVKGLNFWEKARRLFNMET